MYARNRAISAAACSMSSAERRRSRCTSSPLNPRSPSRKSNQSASTRSPSGPVIGGRLTPPPSTTERESLHPALPDDLGVARLAAPARAGLGLAAVPPELDGDRLLAAPAGHVRAEGVVLLGIAHHRPNAFSMVARARPSSTIAGVKWSTVQRPSAASFSFSHSLSALLPRRCPPDQAPPSTSTANRNVGVLRTTKSNRHFLGGANRTSRSNGMSAAFIWNASVSSASEATVVPSPLAEAVEVTVDLAARMVPVVSGMLCEPRKEFEDPYGEGKSAEEAEVEDHGLSHSL